MTNIAQLPAVQQVDTLYTQDVMPVLDTAKFEHMHRIATAMSDMSMLPYTLRGDVKDGKIVTHFDRSVVVANCFRIVNQAVRWGLDPFAVVDCASIIHGKLMWEGKLVAAVIDAKLGVALDYTFDDKPGRQLGVIVSGTLPGEAKPRTIKGTVAVWHKGEKSPWAKESDWERQLRYMGAREWVRAHKPAVMLGVYADDVLHDIAALDVPAGQRAIRLKAAETQKPTVLVLPDIPDEAPQAEQDQTSEAREAISQAISVEMLEHLRSAFDEADWEVLAPAYDKKHDELKART